MSAGTVEPSKAQQSWWVRTGHLQEGHKGGLLHFQEEQECGLLHLQEEPIKGLLHLQGERLVRLHHLQKERIGGLLHLQEERTAVSGPIGNNVRKSYQCSGWKSHHPTV